MLTLTDLFCGAGGSSTGAIAVPGVTVRIASNHWDLAVETHNTNHPGADHLCADLAAVDPRRFPRTDLLWASPECTNHSVARGRKRADTQPDLFGEVLPDAAAERSRATMWDVPRFAEVHRYQAVVVENVVDAWHWEPFRAWLMAMDSLGYDHHVVFLNSMHAQAFGPGAPQSRDRMYVVFWRKGNQRPGIERVTAPTAVCPMHGDVRARQVFKRADRTPWGRYRQQYVYTCSTRGCHQIVEPHYRPAAEIIDWRNLPALSDAVQAGGWTWRNMATWWKPGVRMQKGRFSSSAEYLLYGTNGPVLDGAASPQNVFKCRIDVERDHIAQKPTPVMEWALGVVPPGALVLDPFMGSGATLEAARNLGHTAIGIDVDERYCEVAARRLDQQILDFDATTEGMGYRPAMSATPATAKDSASTAATDPTRPAAPAATTATPPTSETR